MNINEIINQKVKEVISSDKLAGYINERVEKHIEDIVKDTLDNIFGWNGYGRKEIKEIIQEKIILPSRGDISLPAYNKIISSIIQEKLSGTMNDTLIKKVNEELENFIKPQGTLVKFSEIIEKFKSHVKEKLDEDDLDYDDGYAYVESTIIVETGTSGIGNTKWINLDIEPDKGKYQCKYIFAIEPGETPYIYGLRIRNVDYKKDLVLGGLNHFESFLVNLYLTKTPIEIDVDLDDLDNEIEIEYEY